MVECDNLSLKSKSLSRTPLQKHSQCYLHTSIQYTRQARLTDKKEEVLLDFLSLAIIWISRTGGLYL